MYCIYHSRDLDGWMSAAIVKKWAELNARVITLIGWDYGNPTLLDKNGPYIEDGESVVMVDISFPKQEMELLSLRCDFAWIDHHISAINDMASILGSISGLRNPKFAACELTWQYFFPDMQMPNVVRMIGRYDCFGHKGTAEEQKVLEYQYAARSYFKNVDDCYEMINVAMGIISVQVWMMDLPSKGEAIYKYLCTEAEQEYKNVFPINLNGYNIAAINKQRFNPINFGIDYHKDGYDAFMCFWYANKKYNFSLYNDNGKVDCSEICKQFGGGGHKGASGFITDKIDFLFNQQ